MLNEDGKIDTGKIGIAFSVAVRSKVEDISAINLSAEFFFIGRTDEELSTVYDEKFVAEFKPGIEIDVRL